MHKAFLGVCLLVASLLTVQPALAQNVITSTTLPSYAFQDAQGKNYTLQQFRGRPILLHLWATWCSPCITEIPSISQLATTYGPQGLQVLPLSQDFSAAKVLNFFQKYNITGLPALIDTNSEVFGALGTRGLPITILIDANGNEVRRFPGNVNWQDPAIIALVRQYLPQ